MFIVKCNEIHNRPEVIILTSQEDVGNKCCLTFVEGETSNPLNICTNNHRSCEFNSSSHSNSFAYFFSFQNSQKKNSMCSLKTKLKKPHPVTNQPSIELKA